MPKMKSRKGIKKRFRFTGTGKVVQSRPGSSHLAPGKTQKRIRHLRKEKSTAKGDLGRIKKQLDYIK